MYVCKHLPSNWLVYGSQQKLENEKFKVNLIIMMLSSLLENGKILMTTHFILTMNLIASLWTSSSL
jgi:hypothetical protein